MKLACRTRENSSPQGKPRVYYTGHPEDLAIYRDDIFTDILAACDCAVFYDEEPEKELTEEDKADLKQMQLFVFPITHRFLHQESRFRTEEFPLVKLYSIPLLPLMQEPGLEEDFNKLCGKLHFLSKEETSVFSHWEYWEKLKLFLSSTLVGNDLAKTIRGAFRTHLFLSYRKKDKQDALQLMALLHKEPSSWDTAIWYDEYLVPGENFEKAIQNAIDACHLFVLSVTHNIVEPGNYVITNEYPLAVKWGKPILPVEMKPADTERLMECFPQLPPCVKKDCEASLAGALTDKLPLPSGEPSPERRFLLGLAYLNGVSVEVNRKRGLFLFTQAADQGLGKAIERLIRIYQGEENTPPCPPAVAWWRKKRIEQLGAQLMNGGSRSELRTYLEEFGRLSEMCGEYSLEELEEVSPACRQALEQFERLQADGGLLEDRRLLAKSYMSYGDICCEISGRRQEAGNDPLFQRLQGYMLEKGRYRFWLSLFTRPDWREAVDGALAKQTHGVDISEHQLALCRSAMERRDRHGDRLRWLYIKRKFGWSSDSPIWDLARSPEKDSELELFTLNWYLYLKRAYGLTRYTNAPDIRSKRERARELLMSAFQSPQCSRKELLTEVWQLEEEIYRKARGEEDLKLLWSIYPLISSNPALPRLRQAASESETCYEKSRELQARIALEAGAEEDREALSLFSRGDHRPLNYADWWVEQLGSPAEQPLPL